VIINDIPVQQSGIPAMNARVGRQGLHGRCLSGRYDWLRQKIYILQ
jgi:hypothetical protein